MRGSKLKAWLLAVDALAISLLVIAPSERRMRIEVGKGLKGELTDLEAGQILDNVIKPYLRAFRWEEAFIAGADAIAARLETPHHAPLAHERS